MSTPVATNDSCIACNGPREKKLHCSRCKTAPYCSRACQMQHWPTHKLDCISEEEIPALANRECSLVARHELFARAVGCLRRRNRELALLPKDADDYGRRVAFTVRVQSRAQLPESLQAAGEVAFSIRFGNLAEEDKDPVTGEPAWEACVVPSRGGMNVRVKLPADVPLLNNATYEEYITKGVLSGHVPLVAYAGGELVPLGAALGEALPDPLTAGRDSAFAAFVSRHKDRLQELADARESRALEVLHCLTAVPTPELTERRRSAIRAILPLLC
jgi:hypothetical protein